ncbi:TVP38/TMEM64 family protein [Limimonas halophila]|nr:TVP38/TMEM64 family protein [Limimonas halophila]
MSTKDQADAPNQATGTGRRSRLTRWLPLLALVAGFVLFFALGLDKYLSFDALAEHRAWLEQQVADNAVLAAAAFVVVYALVAAFSIPGGAFLTILGGFLFGTIGGAIYAVTGATIGAVAVFLAARTALGDALRERAGSAVERMRAGFQEDAMNYLLFLRLIPVFPFWLVNLVPAFLGVPLRTYAIGTFLGIAPGSVVYASVGNGVGNLIAVGEKPNLGIIFEPSILGPIIGLALLSMLPVGYKKYRAWRAARG